MKLRLALIATILINLNSLKAQDYQMYSAFNRMKRTGLSENQLTGEITGITGRSNRLDAMLVKTWDSNMIFRVDGSVIPLYAMALLYDKETPFDAGFFDMNFGKSFNHKRPIEIGPLEWYLGMGFGLGLKMFDSQIAETNGFLSFGLSINSIINIGENFQFLYINSVHGSYNPRYESMGRTMHEFFIFYNSKFRIQPSFAPYIETFRYEEKLANGNIYENKTRYVGFKFGLTKTIE